MMDDTKDLAIRGVVDPQDLKQRFIPEHAAATKAHWFVVGFNVLGSAVAGAGLANVISDVPLVTIEVLAAACVAGDQDACSALQIRSTTNWGFAVVGLVILLGSLGLDHWLRRAKGAENPDEPGPSEPQA